MVVRDMFFMPYRMTIWTENMQIIWTIVISIIIIMMQSKNFWNFIVSTIFTFFYPTPSFKSHSSIFKSTFSAFHKMIFSAFDRTKNSISRLERCKNFFTKFTVERFCFESSITRKRTKFCNIFPIISYIEFIPTFFTKDIKCH